MSKKVKPNSRPRHWIEKPQFLGPIIVAIITGLFGWSNNWFIKSAPAVSINSSGSSKSPVNTGAGVQNNDFKENNSNNPVTNKTTIIQKTDLEKTSRLVFVSFVFGSTKPYKLASDSTGVIFNIKNAGNDFAENITITPVYIYYRNNTPHLGDHKEFKSITAEGIAPGLTHGKIVYLHQPTQITDTVFFYMKLDYTNTVKRRMAPLRQIYFYKPEYIGKELPLASDNEFKKIAALLTKNGLW
jgi:hypothetical protein